MHLPGIEIKPLKEIKRYQESRLPGLLQYLQEHSAFYARHFKSYGIRIEKIKTLEDLTAIPVTSKDYLQRHNDDFVCVPKNRVVDLITTSGTSGEPVTFAMTDADLDRLAYNEYISFCCANTTSDDIYQLMLTLDKRFMAGMAYFLGLRKLGAGIIRVGPGLPEQQFDSIRRFSPTGLVTVPSFIPKLIDYAIKNGIDYKNTSIKKAVCIGEPIRNPDFSLNTLGQRIAEKWDIKLYSTYASTEMGTAFTECEAGQGGHHHPEMIIVEFLDENNNPVGEGEAGEVTITTLGIEAMPLLRFKTGDICHHYNAPCSCGRTTMRLGPVIGRKQQLLKFKGTSLYPPAIYDVLNGIEEIENYIVEVSTGPLGTDEILIRAGCDNPHKDLESIIKDHFRAKLRVAPEVRLFLKDEIFRQQMTRLTRKPLIFVDKRNP